MNLTLSQQEGITVLTVTGPVDVRNLQILKAGITKLFRDGKNRIVLELKDTENLEEEVIKEIGVLNQFAKELAGSIAVACANPDLRKSIEGSSEPPIVALFDTTAPAVKHIIKGGAGLKEVMDPEALKTAMEAKDKEIEALKNQVSVMDPKEITTLRAESVELQTKLREMEEHVKQLMLERRVPPDSDAYETKIAGLNELVAELTDKVAAATGKKG